jgi:hypothetical protein
MRHAGPEQSTNGTVDPEDFLLQPVLYWPSIGIIPQRFRALLGRSLSLRGETGELDARCHISATPMKLDVVDAVLNAADEWVSAQEALVAAKQVSEETGAEEEAVDIAGSRLVVAVTRWRSNTR